MMPLFWIKEKSIHITFHDFFEKKGRAQGVKKSEAKFCLQVVK